jgi:LemA protein
VVSGYNLLVALDETVQEKWSNVQNQYQKRSDLVPNLVATVKAAAGSEKEILTGVIEARASATKLTVDIHDAEQLAEYQNKQQGLSQALGRLMMVTEQYPQIQSNQNFLGLQSQIEGVENRISVERTRYNEEVKKFNTKVRSFPTNILAGFSGFEKYETFKASKKSQEAPDVSTLF